jgi:hypothetical protein
MRRCEGVDLCCRIYGRLPLGCLAGYVVELVACDEGIRSCRNCESGWAALILVERKLWGWNFNEKERAEERGWSTETISEHTE